MDKIAIISGPALGHIGRVFKVALALRAYCTLDIHIFYPESSRYAQELIGDEFKSISVSSQGENFLERGICFSNELEFYLQKGNFNLIIQDTNPLNWTSLVRFPDVPRINITNVFLTRFGSSITYQEQTFKKFSDQLNNLRRVRGLKRLKTCFELYESDLVLLADPKPIVDLMSRLPENYIQCGACFWEFEGKLPTSLTDKDDIILLSMGSTGRTTFQPKLIQALSNKFGNITTVYAGKEISSSSEGLRFDYCYKWLPLGKVLARSKAVVSQGGTGSSYQALYYACPVIVFPSHQNHRILGELLEKLGVGFCMDDSTSTGDLADLEINKMNEAASGFSSVMLKENGAKKMAIEIMSLM